MQRYRERDGGRQIFYTLVHSTNGCNDYGCASLKPGASLRSPHLSVCCFPRYDSIELDSKWSGPYELLVQQAAA